MNTGEIEVVGDFSEPMATRWRHTMRREAGVVMPLTGDQHPRVAWMACRFGATGQRRNTRFAVIISAAGEAAERRSNTGKHRARCSS